MPLVSLPHSPQWCTAGCCRDVSGKNRIKNGKKCARVKCAHIVRAYCARSRSWSMSNGHFVVFTANDDCGIGWHTDSTHTLDSMCSLGWNYDDGSERANERTNERYQIRFGRWSSRMRNFRFALQSNWRATAKTTMTEAIAHTILWMGSVYVCVYLYTCFIIINSITLFLFLWRLLSAVKIYYTHRFPFYRCAHAVDNVCTRQRMYGFLLCRLARCTSKMSRTFSNHNM